MVERTDNNGSLWSAMVHDGPLHQADLGGDGNWITTNFTDGGTINATGHA